MKNKNLKRRIIQISYNLGLSHIGSCLTAVDIINEIYQKKKPDEKFILSAGHAHLAHAIVMQKYDPEYDVEANIQEFGIHCDRRAGCDFSTGSLGHGIGAAVGMAFAYRDKNVYCLLSDGECAEGSVWEAFNVIRENKLDNLKLYLNDNGYGAYKRTVFPIMPDFIEWIYTGKALNDYPKYLQGQLAHYKVLNEAEYKEVMNLLQ